MKQVIFHENNIVFSIINVFIQKRKDEKHTRFLTQISLKHLDRSEGSEALDGSSYN